MGVKGLWQLVLPCGKIVNVESLQGKILAVDISIWLNKLAKGVNGDNGFDSDRYLILIFHRICKLLYYGIKPIFVFDGGVPDVKKKTLMERKKRRIDAENLEHRTKNLITKNKLQMKALELLSNPVARDSSPQKTKKTKSKKQSADLFQIASSSHDKQSNTSSSKEDLMRLIGENVKQGMQNIQGLDTEGDEFKSLPAEVQHEILVELKELRRRRSRYADAASLELPKEATNFSDFQLSNVIKTGKITTQIDRLRKEMNSGLSADFFDSNVDIQKETVKMTSKRNISEDNQKYVLLKKKRSGEVNNLFNTSLFDEEKTSTKNSACFQRIERIPANLNALKCFNSTKVKRARFLSESSDEEMSSIDIQTSPKATIQNDVEYMSSSSTDDENQNDIQLVQLAASNSDIDSSFVEDSIEDFQEIKNSHVADNTVKAMMSQVIVDESDSGRNLNDESFETLKNVANVTSSKKTVDVADIDETAKNADVTTIHENVKYTDVKSIDKASEDINIANIEEQNHDSSDKNVAVVEHEKPPELSKDDVVLETYDEVEEMQSPSLESDITDLVESNDINEKQEIKTQESVVPKKEISSLRHELIKQREQLETKKRSHTMIAKEVSNEMYDEVQELLELFGIPFIVSPTEAESQCAFLEIARLTNGSITDDGDVFLFGGMTVYKNFFNQDKHIELYTSVQLDKDLSMTREKLVALAFLTGSDYTPGLPGVGAVTGMEILQEFDENSPRDSLTRFQEWISLRKTKPTHVLSERIATKLKNIVLPRSFNSDEVWDAYLEPEVNRSKEEFEWGLPDHDSLRKFTKERFNWSKNRCDEYLEPVFKVCSDRKKFGKSRTLDSYFPKIVEENVRKVNSKRLNRVFNKMKEKKENNTKTS